MNDDATPSPEPPSPGSTSLAPDRAATAAPLRRPGLLLGLGLGGFVDGILLHQVLQWHHMVSQRVPPASLADLERNILADGVFHTVTWVAVLVGVHALVRVTPQLGPGLTRVFLAWCTTGWGAFNLVEGLVNHHVLQLHRVRPDASDPLVWDLGWLAFGAVLIAAGLAVVRHHGEPG